MTFQIIHNKMEQEKTQIDLLEIRDKLKTLLDNEIPQNIILEINTTGGNKMVAATEKKPIKKKRPMYGEDVKKKVVSLFVEGKTLQQIMEELKKIFPNQRMPKIKACRRYVRAAGHSINGKK